MDLKAKAIEGVLWKQAYDDMGIYPQSVIGGPNAYSKRTEKMEGWNDAVSAFSEAFDKLSDWYESLPADHKELIGDLLLEEKLDVYTNEDGCKICINCSDTFYWGCSDSEEISVEDLPSLVECYKLSPSYGGELWVCRKRGMRPQTASYSECYPEAEWHLFDACGPERDDPDGRGKRVARK